MYKYVMYYIGSMRGTDYMYLFADSIDEAKEKALAWCSLRMYTLEKVKKF